MTIKKFSSKTLLFAGSVAVIGFFVSASLWFVPHSIGAQNPAFQAPLAPAPDNALVNEVEEVTGFLKKDVGAEVQDIVSPLVFGTSTAATLWLRAGALPASIVGKAGDAAVAGVPPFALSGVTNAAVYGYGYGDDSATGVEGSAVGSVDSSGVGIQTLVTNALGTAAAFNGRVFVSRDLYVEDFISAPHVAVAAADADVPSITATGGVSVSAPLLNGAYGEAYGGASGVYGVYGQTISPQSDPARSSGIYAVNSIGSGASFTSQFYGILAQSAASATAVGARGVSASGNGVAALIGSSSTAACMKAQATGATGHALHGSGGAFAGFFEGDVELSSGSSFFIGATGIGQENLRELIRWCNSGGRRFCPDAYE